MLKRYEKRRYICIIIQDNNNKTDLEYLFKQIKKFASELFGTISIEQAFLKSISIKTDKNVLIIKCSLEKLDMILLTIALIRPALSIFGVYGTIKKLEKDLST